MKIPERDINYEVADLPPAIKGKVTEFAKACGEYAFIGTYSEDQEICEAIETGFQVARYDLEKTIMTFLNRAKKKT